MLHASILPYEENWRQCAHRSNIYSCADPDFVRFLKNLKLVAVDELHYYSGVFGTYVRGIRLCSVTEYCSFFVRHVAYIMRRLRRICAAVGSKSIADRREMV